jgi:predicted MPP superfamily phosphohydrolase
MFHGWLLYLGTFVAIVALALAFLSQRYWFAQAWRFAGRVHDPAWRKGLRSALLVFLAIVALMAITDVVQNLRGTISRGSWWSAFLGYWLSSSILSYVLIKIISAVDWAWTKLRPAFSARPQGSPASPVAGAGARSEGVDHSRRHFFHSAGLLAGAIPFASFAYGFVAERFRFEVREIQIPIANLPPALDGMRITQISDIHASSFMPLSEVRRAVGMANELGSALTVVTGDFLTTRTDPLADCIGELSRLRAPLGVWGCNGNHEVYARAESAAATLFRRHGMHLLRAENAELRWNGSALNLIGVDYQAQRDAEGNRATMLVGVERLVRRDVPNILLSHNPNSFPRAAELGIELSLAGHTHGGQVRVEILNEGWSPARFLTPYVAGLYQRPLLAPEHLTEAEAATSVTAVGTSNIYVNRGLGTIGAPVRLGVPPEITLITLRRA